MGVIFGLSIPCWFLEANELILNKATCNLLAPLISKGVFGAKSNMGFRDKSYRISIYLITAGSIKISISIVGTAFRFIILWYCAWRSMMSLCSCYNLQFWGLQYRRLCFSSPPTCRRSVKRISRSGTGALRDVLTPPRGWARNKIRRCALLRLCPSQMGCWLTGARPDFITARVPVHGRVRRRRNVC